MREIRAGKRDSLHEVARKSRFLTAFGMTKSLEKRKAWGAGGEKQGLS
jgi:hypothetical protein